MRILSLTTENTRSRANALALRSLSHSCPFQASTHRLTRRILATGEFDTRVIAVKGVNESNGDISTASAPALAVEQESRTTLGEKTLAAPKLDPVCCASPEDESLDTFRSNDPIQPVVRAQ